MYEKMGSLESYKLLIEKPFAWKVLVRIAKRYVSQMTLLDDS